MKKIVLKIGKRKLEYYLERKWVQNINLRVLKEGYVVVSAPPSISRAIIDEFMARKADWIIHHLDKFQKEKTETQPPIAYTDGAKMVYLGKQYTLRIKQLKESQQLELERAEMQSEEENVVLSDSNIDTIKAKAVPNQISFFDILRIDANELSAPKPIELKQAQPIRKNKEKASVIRIELREESITLYTEDIKDEARIKWQINTWYKRQIGEVISAAFNAAKAKNAEQFGDKYGLRIKAMSSRWGSCSLRTRMITINSNLIFAPFRCLEYVIAHEICHLKEANHGKNFYALQAKQIPDWQQCRHTLNKETNKYINTIIE